jgi:hypothetical protein
LTSSPTDVPFTDGPSTYGSFIFNHISANDYFEDYLIFRPGDLTTNDNIWVTLRKMKWRWGSSAIWQGQWNVTNDCPPPEDLGPSDEFHSGQILS